MRDNIHSHDLIKCFWNYFKKPKAGEVYNIGGGRKSNCSIIEAINYVELLTNIKVKKIIKKPTGLVIIFGTFLIQKNLEKTILIGNKNMVLKK